MADILDKFIGGSAESVAGGYYGASASSVIKSVSVKRFENFT